MLKCRLLWPLGHRSILMHHCQYHLLCSQKAWDTSVVKGIADHLLENASDERSRAQLLVSTHMESGAWLNALPLSHCGLRMDDETVWVAVGLRLGAPLCYPHQCYHCGTEVNDLATHGLNCWWNEGWHTHHAAINDIICRSLVTTKVPSRLEPAGLYRSDGKRPDGISLIPLKNGKCQIWDVTCPDMYAPSHVGVAARVLGRLRNRPNKLSSSSTLHWSPRSFLHPLPSSHLEFLVPRRTHSWMIWAGTWCQWP